MHTARRLRISLKVAALLGPIALASGIACGGASAAGPTPSNTTALQIVPHTEQLAVGSVVDLTLLATLADGTTIVVTPEWWTDNPDVLLVKPLSTSRTDSWPDEKAAVIDHYLRAQVTAQNAGVATVFADSPYGRGQQVIRVVAR
jgi:hypothetical protein